MEIVIGYALKTVALPPGFNIVIALFGLLFFRRTSRIRWWIVGFALGTLWLWSTPFVSAWLAHSLEDYQAFKAEAVADAQAIVLLGAGRYAFAPEYGDRDTIGYDTLERVRYTAHLARQLQLPIAIAGGRVNSKVGLPISELMRDVLTNEFDVQVRWLEGLSRNTAENASRLRAVLPVDRIILVTHAIHMKRATWAFERAGFKVTPAPMGYKSRASIFYTFFNWLPSESALAVSRAVLHEWIGITYYKLRY